MTQTNKSARKASIYFEELLKTLPSLADKTIAITGTTSGTGLVAARTCAAADRTGHALLHTLYQNNVKEGANFLNEWFAVDLVKNSFPSKINPSNKTSVSVSVRKEHPFFLSSSLNSI